MGGLLILALFLGYVQLVWFICKKTPTIWAKALVLLVAVLAVSADAIYGRKKLEQMCEQEGGLKIYETVENVRGFEDRLSISADFWIKEHGYQYVEVHGDSFYQDGKLSYKLDRISLQSNGSILFEKNINAKSTYVLEFTKEKHIQTEGNYLVSSFVIVNKTNNNILATYSTLGYSGGWVERFMKHVYAGGGYKSRCSNYLSLDVNYWYDNVVNVLKPPKKEL